MKCGVVPKLHHQKPAPPFARSVVEVAAKVNLKALVYVLTLTICLWMIHCGLPQLGANGGEHLWPHVAGEDAVTVRDNRLGRGVKLAIATKNVRTTYCALKGWQSGIECAGLMMKRSTTTMITSNLSD